VHELIEAKPKFEAAGIELVLIYESGEEVLKTYTEDAQIPYVTISDSEQKLFDSYRVDKSFGKMLRTMTKKAPKAAMKEGKQLYGGNIPKADGSLTRIPADFLIDERGVLQKVHYGRFIGDHISFSEIFE
jgi:peroxiredoxin